MNLGRLRPVRRTGQEPFHANGEASPFNLLDFGAWSGSDLVENTTRGLVAEYIVARALGVDTGGVREGWAPFDLTTPEGVRVEVKSAAHLQSWYQKKPSVISFSIKKSTAWNPDTNQFEGDQRRQADVYVFALLAHQDKATLDPLNLDQWEFYVLATQAIEEHRADKQSISLAALRRLGAGPHSYQNLRRVVAEAGL